MAKIGLTKLGLSINKDIKEIEWNGQKIEVKQYLPIDDKLALCARVINNSADDINYYNPGKLMVYQDIEILKAYTNINFTEKILNTPTKLFDLVYSSGLAAIIYEQIPQIEVDTITHIINTTIKNIYEYKNSALGIMSAISTDYEGLKLDATEIQKKLIDGEGVEFLKEVMNKLG